MANPKKGSVTEAHVKAYNQEKFRANRKWIIPLFIIAVLIPVFVFYYVEKSQIFNSGDSNAGTSNDTEIRPEATIGETVPADVPKVDITITRTPFEEHGTAYISATIKTEDRPENLVQYEIWVSNPSGKLGPSKYVIPKADMADGVEDFTIELEDSGRTPVPGEYELVVNELYEKDMGGWNSDERREIFRKPIGTFAGANLTVLEWGSLKYNNIAFPCCSYSVYSVPMKFRNDGDLPAYPWLTLTIDGETRNGMEPFTKGEPAESSGIIWGSGVGPGETVSGYFGAGDWRGPNDEGFSPGSHSVNYVIYESIYSAEAGGYVNENIATYDKTANLIGEAS